MIDAQHLPLERLHKGGCLKAKDYMITFRTSFTRKIFTTSFNCVLFSVRTITSWVSAKPAFMRYLRESRMVLNRLKTLLVNDVLNANLVNDVLNVIT